MPTPSDLPKMAKAIAGSNRLPSLFKEHYSNPKANTQYNLSGRTHYADDGTLRYFSARILSCQVLANGLLLGIVESVGHPSMGRLFRPVFFDIFGTVIGNRRDAAASFKTRKAANAAFWKDIETLNIAAHYGEALTNEQKHAQQMIDQIAEILL